MSQEELNEEPLDPSVERVRKKMMRLMGISISIMMIGLIAVIGAIFYKINSKKAAVPEVAKLPPLSVNSKSASIATQGSIDLPDGSQIIDAYLNAHQILLTLQMEDGTKALWIYDLAKAVIVSRIAVR